MIKFEKIKYKNFLSVGEDEIEIDFSTTYSTLIVGTNGVGKSLMLDALSFALFGKPHRNINKPQLVNSINGKLCKVEVTFSIANSNYTIVRGLKPNIFEIWCNGIMINQESHSRDYQKLLETNILKLNHKSFHQVVVLGSSNFVPFMQLSTYHRREVIEDLLDISIFSKMNSVLKESNSKLKESIKDTEYQFNFVKEKIALQNKHILNIKNINAVTTQQYNSEIEVANNNIKQLLDENLILSKEYEEGYASIKSQLQKDQGKKNTLLSYEQSIKNNIKKIVDDSKFYSETSECPTCRQSISDTIKSHKAEECKAKAKELSEGYSNLKESLQQVATELQNSEQKLSDILKVSNKISNNQSQISQYENQIRSLQKNITDAAIHTDCDSEIIELDKLKESKEILSDLKSSQLEERTYNEVIGELLKDSGIKTKVIRQYLPVMNKLINNYLQILDFFVSFNLDENFNETIRSRHRDDFSYASFSEGEKSRIDLSLLFAWRQIAKMKNSNNTNLLILDEVFDASLDSDGVDNLLKIMNTLDSDTRIFVISHKQDLLESKFDRKIEFEKHKNFTRIKTSS